MTFDEKVNRIQLLLNKTDEEELIGAYLDSVIDGSGFACVLISMACSVKGDNQ